MEQFKQTVAKNIAALRTINKMTQADLGNLLSYTDKSISKWERGDSLPDAFVLKKMADIFQVSVDYILTEHSEDEKPPRIKNKYRTVSQLSFVGTLTLAFLVFILLWLIKDIFYWQVFVFALPVSMIVLLVENSIWGRGIWNIFYISGLVLGILSSIYVIFLYKNWWMLFLLCIPAELIILLCFKLRSKKH